MSIFTGDWYSPITHELLQFFNAGYDSYTLIDRSGKRTITTTLMSDNSTMINQGAINMKRISNDFIIYDEVPHINVKMLVSMVSHAILMDGKFDYYKFYELSSENGIEYVKSCFYSMNALSDESYNSVYYNIVRLKQSDDLKDSQAGFRNFLKAHKEYVRNFHVTVEPL